MPLQKEQKKIYNQKYRELNREKVLAQKRKHYAENKERLLEEKKVSYQENREKKLAYQSQYYINNKEKCKEIRKNFGLNNPDYYKDYRKRNSAKVNFKETKRKTAKINRIPKWLTEFDYLKIKCIYQIAAMLTRENKEPWHVDHIIPLQGKLVSGLHVPSNLQVLREKDNCSKSNKFDI